MSSQQKSRGIVDIVFLIDATGSMAPCIDAVKDNIHTFVTTLSTKDANNSSPVKHWRAKVVGYRDFDYNDCPAIVDNPFVECAERLRNQLSALTANGGGDEPESLLDAIYHVATMDVMEKTAQELEPNKWRYRSAAARVIVVFSDASFKEPLRKPAGASIDDVFNVVMSNRIILSIFSPELPCYERLAEVDKAEWNYIEIREGEDAQKALARFVVDQKNFENTMRQLARTISVTAEVPLI